MEVRFSVQNFGFPCNFLRADFFEPMESSRSSYKLHLWSIWFSTPRNYSPAQFTVAVVVEIYSIRSQTAVRLWREKKKTKNEKGNCRWKQAGRE